MTHLFGRVFTMGRWAGQLPLKIILIIMRYSWDNVAMDPFHTCYTFVKNINRRSDKKRRAATKWRHPCLSSHWINAWISTRIYAYICPDLTMLKTRITRAKKPFPSFYAGISFQLHITTYRKLWIRLFCLEGSVNVLKFAIFSVVT